MRIYLSTEGTYPFVLGGVSTWVDMLVHGLPHHDFEIGALVDNPHHRVQYRPPANVTLQPIPLWGLELAEEYLPRREGWRRALRTSSPVVRDRFLPSWEHLVDCLAAPETDPEALGDSLSAVAHFAERYDLRRALGDAAAWALLLERLQANPIHARTGLAPAMDFARTMYRYLLPLTAPTPVCDVAHSSAAALCVLPAIVAKYRYGTPLVLTEHGIYLRERLLAMSTESFGTKVLFANFYRAVVELAYREADVLTPVCGYNAGWSLGVEPERIRVIHNGVDPARIDVWPETDEAPTVGFVGRIDPLKDILTLIQAFARVRAVIRNARLRIWGPATSPGYLKECHIAVSVLGLTEAVTFEGPTNDVAAAYGASHVIGLSSISEAFPYTAVEAMLAGRPIVATGVGGVAEALGPAQCRRTSMVVEPGDPGAMAEALLAVLGASSVERHHLGQWLRARALTLFTAQRMFDDYDDVYTSLARRVPSATPASADRAIAHARVMTAGTVQTTEAGELGLHIAARTVVGRCPAPLNAVEVAVVLETCGYTPKRARALGADGLDALAERVFALVPLYSSALAREALAPVALRARPPGPLDLARGLAYSSPWLVSLATLLISGVSFWSSNIAIPSIADAVTLATAVALLVTGPFVQAFGRRASFYIGLGDQGMVVRITRWTLELGLLSTALAALALFVVRNDVLRAGTPATARLGLAAAIAIAALQLGLAAFYVRRAFLSIGVIVGGGAAVLLWFVSHAGPYTDPTVLVVWQIRLVAVMAALCWLWTAWWLLRVESSAPAPLWRPSGSALIRAVAPYGLYGLAFFAIVVVPQLVSGGLLQGRYSFNVPLAMTSGVAIVVLVPLLAQTVASTEHLLARQFPAWLSRYTVAQTDEFRRQVVRYWRDQLIVLGGLAVAAGAVVIVVAPRLGATFPILGDLAEHPGLLAACTVGYLCLGVGLFCSQLLFSLSAPMRPLAAAWAGLVALVAASITAGWAGNTVATVSGLVAGAGVYSCVAVVLAHRAFTRADLTYYRTL